MAAYGTVNFQDLPLYSMGAGIQTEYGTIIGPGARLAAYVRSTGIQNTDPPELRRRLVPTLNQGLAECRSGFGDVVVVLPGHAENISSANQMSSMVAGTRIIGLGRGTLRPTFTWTAATATWLFNVANVSLYNCILNMDPGTGTVNVAAPITVSAAGCSILGCQSRMGTDANSKVTIGITLTTGGDDFTMADCEAYGATAAGCTTQLRLTAVKRAKVIGSKFSGATTAVGVGVVQFLTTASTDVSFLDCFFQNSVASSTAAFTGMTGATGEINRCRASVLSGGAAAYATLGSLVIFNSQASNALGGGNAISPAAQTMA